MDTINYELGCLSRFDAFGFILENGLMTKATAFLVLLLFAGPLCGEVHHDSWLAQDKLLHVCMSSVIATTAYHAHRHEHGGSGLESHLFAAEVTFVVGLAKEMRDGRFSYRDLVADCVGLALGIFLATR